LKNRKLYIIHLGLSGFPHGSAAINKSLLILKAVATGHDDVKIKIINNRAVHSENIPIKLSKSGWYNNLNYKYTTPTVYRPKSFITRQLSKIIGKFNEFLLIVSLKFKGKLDLAFIYLPTDSFSQLIYYRLLSRVLSFPLIISWVEYFSEFENRKSRLLLKVNDYLFDHYFMRFVDGILPISEFLVRKLGPSGKPYLKIPALVDFEIFDKLTRNPEKSFVYCGSAGYTDNLKLIISAFDLIQNNDFNLVLIVNGSNVQLDKVNTLIENSDKRYSIRHFMNLEYTDLLQYYYNAAALLIPLKNSKSDEARFPQKIAEYTATGNPIIINNCGDVGLYFRDNENALIAYDYSPESFAAKMNLIIQNPENSQKIGAKGKMTGLQYFDYRKYSSGIHQMINRIIKFTD
jgi:glycosyltransferase involved in cell wall biosynthesis